MNLNAIQMNEIFAKKKVIVIIIKMNEMNKNIIVDVRIFNNICYNLYKFKLLIVLLIFIRLKKNMHSVKM